jgi:hypothetical protein
MQIMPPAQRRPLAVEPAAARVGSRGPVEAWRALGWIGAAFFLLGTLDIALGWYPLALGNLEWEFGTISGSLNALAIPMLGLYLALASAVARGNRRAARTVSVVMGLMLAAILFAGVLYLTVLPVALKSVAGNELVALGIKKAGIKALTLGTVDAVLLAMGMVKGWRAAPLA